MSREALVVIDFETLPTELREGEESEWAAKNAPTKPSGYDLIGDSTTIEDVSIEAYKTWIEKYYVPHKGLKDKGKIEEHKQQKWESFLVECADYKEKYNSTKNEWQYNKRPFQLGGSRVIATGLALIDPYEDCVKDIAARFSEQEVDHASFINSFVQGLGKVRWVGYNILRFDLPNLALLYHRARMELPENAKIGKWNSIDLMKQPLSYQGGCKKMCDVFGINQADSSVDGSKVRELYLNGEVEKIKSYVADDVKIEAELFLAISRTHNLM